MAQLDSSKSIDSERSNENCETGQSPKETWQSPKVLPEFINLIRLLQVYRL